ncbi:MAG: DUF898 family protein [Candidatus Lambdaproteobacteria bacterium]|nr:DUF898 family protein [Candidatus Lambdaproteobacteria bacterium]
MWFRGRLGEMVGLHLVNLLLTLVTLGIYHFWARTRMRRYVWSHLWFDGEQFAYTGRPRELLVGYGKALLLLVPLLLLFNLNPVYVNHPLLVALYAAISLAVYGGFIVFGGIAQFGARRYRLSRTRWRNIRFGLGGSALGFGALTLGYALLTAFSAGLYTPFMRHHLAAYQLSRGWFGSARVAYTGTAGPLFRLFIKVWLAAVAFIVAAPFAVGLLLATLAPGWLPVAPALVIAAVAVAVIVAWYSYVAGELRYLAAHARLCMPVGTDRAAGSSATGAGSPLRAPNDARAAEGLRFRLTFSGPQFAWMAVSSLALTFGTLGLAFPWVLRRKLDFACRHLDIAGRLDYDAVQQQQDAAPAFGEGLADALDIGDLGL